jgi:hypothetical protein
MVHPRDPAAAAQGAESGTKRHCAGGLITCPGLRDLRTLIEGRWNPEVRLPLTRTRLG